MERNPGKMISSEEEKIYLNCPGIDQDPWLSKKQRYCLSHSKSERSPWEVQYFRINTWQQCGVQSVHGCLQRRGQRQERLQSPPRPLHVGAWALQVRWSLGPVLQPNHHLIALLSAQPWLQFTFTLDKEEFKQNLASPGHETAWWINVRLDLRVSTGQINSETAFWSVGFGLQHILLSLEQTNAPHNRKQDNNKVLDVMTCSQDRSGQQEDFHPCKQRGTPPPVENSQFFPHLPPQLADLHLLSRFELHPPSSCSSPSSPSSSARGGWWWPPSWIGLRPPGWSLMGDSATVTKLGGRALVEAKHCTPCTLQVCKPTPSNAIYCNLR